MGILTAAPPFNDPSRRDGATPLSTHSARSRFQSKVNRHPRRTQLFSRINFQHSFTLRAHFARSEAMKLRRSSRGERWIICDMANWVDRKLHF
ncbi:uncharacterized protein LOC143217257 isoform X2 [Lasioglossum baleicum]|uniref:uncharacterized protein LOC143217257 isoform X2 n=1 Tax=Lasioglossum baleicum TaxID=434251 RepID=UPI003FCE69F6